MRRKWRLQSGLERAPARVPPSPLDGITSQSRELLFVSRLPGSFLGAVFVPGCQAWGRFGGNPGPVLGSRRLSPPEQFSGVRYGLARKAGRAVPRRLPVSERQVPREPEGNRLEGRVVVHVEVLAPGT